MNVFQPYIGVKNSICGQETAYRCDVVRDYAERGIHREVIKDFSLQGVGQRGDNNCLGACGETVDRSFGGNMTQEQLRNATLPGSDPMRDPMNDVDVWHNYNLQSGHAVDAINSQPDMANRISFNAAKNNRISLDIQMDPAEPVGHAIVVNKVTKLTILKLNGNVIQTYKIQVFDPGHGGSFYNLSPSNISKIVTRAFFIHP